MANISGLNVNGSVHTVEADEKVSLLSVLRDQFDLTGTKYGCGEGVRSLHRPDRWPVAPLVRHSVGAVGGRRSPPLRAWPRASSASPAAGLPRRSGHAVRAYCTSGMIMTAAALLKTKPNPSEAEIVEYMEGNVCRCGTYPRIVAAIAKGARALRDLGRQGAGAMSASVKSPHAIEPERYELAAPPLSLRSGPARLLRSAPAFWWFAF
jgi:hypothetical protein